MRFNHWNFYSSSSEHTSYQISTATLCSISTVGGGGRDRTDDLRLAKPALSHLSYAPGVIHQMLQRPQHYDIEMVGLGRLELPTSRLSGVRSNQAELQAHNLGQG